ncbi:hypothetical protein SPAB_05703 [Salmonella enterica subsp. enterica serovar Paratyphi B str. SPB7]|uniref:Uncharacterized protein n=1 Tax=Salmonella paratyphi B (strain ATCC BAA-1250 / SPB7) TaxID=1016998 RepID=A0A6C6ZBI4_SALPB|nr:hypothetical protein SPAB_05703 [Salmonella enterica subsp. enterica serovar Paratyphi B str. SPB7]
MIPRITQGMCLNIFFVSIVKPGCKFNYQPKLGGY